MSPVESLFLVVVVIYLIQCISWVTPGASVFALSFRGRGKRKPRGFVWSALRTEGFLAAPFPPLTPLTVVAWPSFQLDPQGITVLADQGEPLFLSWDNLTLTHTESRVLCNDRAVFRGSEAHVLAYFALIQKVQRATIQQRGPMIERWISRAMSPPAVTRRLKVFAGRSWWLRIFANMQFIFLFLIVPLAFAAFGPRILWRVILLLLAMSAFIALEFWTAHRKLFPQAGGARLKAVVTIVLSPVAAIRACDVVARDLLGRSHPLAAAGGLLQPPEFAALAGEQLRLCRFSGQPDKWYQQTLGKFMERAIRQKGGRPEALLRPGRQDQGCIVYCPRCLAQYTRDVGICADCGFERVLAFATTSTGGAKT
jgi:hypothetical protein